MARRTVDIAVIIPDASPVLTLARIGRLDLFDTFSAPIRIVDQVHYEITKPAHDSDGKVAAWLKRMGNRITIVETNVGVGFQTRRSRDPRTPSGNLGEIAVDEYATLAHLLDNPVWHALIGPHANIATGRGLARHYPRDIAPFSAIADATTAAYADLAAHLPPGTEARLFRPMEEQVPSGWETISSRPIIQMMADDVAAPNAALQHGLIELGVDDAEDMLRLAEIAKPGPLGPRTHTLGAYVGYRDRGRLLSMGGERFRLPGFVELSAICVHPDVRGRGIGAAITLHLARAALARGETPFLHVFPHNPATALYRRLGFRERAQLWVIWRRVRSEG